MEDNKPQIVRWFHERNIAKRVASGETISAEEQAENEAALAAVDHAPKQTWGSIFSGRVVGTAAVYASMALVGTPLKKISAHIGQITADNIATPTAHPLVKRITESGTLDAAATAICTSMLYVWSHFLCPPKDTLTPIAANDSITPRTESIPMLVSDTTTNTAHADKLTPTKTYQQHILTTSNELPSIQRL